MKEETFSDIMTCVEKRHMSHRVGSMLHHRFPNGFTDLFMDETDREVSTLTDRAFRSLCIGDDAVYNDEFSYGYSPFSCHKPLAGEPHKKTAKDAKKRNEKHESQQKTMSQMSSFLKALSATEESYGGVFKKNGITDSNGESWDKSALRSIQKELSEFSADYNTNLADRHYKNHQRHSSGDNSSNKTGKDKSLSSGKLSKNKNVKLKKLNIKNFFLHSELSPFQAWADLNRFAFPQDSIVASIVPEGPVPKWFDLPFYKELSEAPKIETPQAEEPEEPFQPEPSDPPPPPLPTVEAKPIPPPVPPKVLPKPVIMSADKRCTSEGGDGTTAPWRRNRSRATSALPIHPPATSTQDTTKQLDENLLLLKKVDENLLLLKRTDENQALKKEARSVEVKTVEEANSLASTPFSICQLMTPIIPSRQPTDTSEILSVLSPSALDLALRPQSEVKVTPEPPPKRDGYKSLASSILFNLKDNRKRVKSRYSPRRFKMPEETESGTPLSDHVKQAFAEGLASGLNTPAIINDVEEVCSPLSEVRIQSVDLAKQEAERPLSNDYLLSHLLQSKAEVEASPMSPLLQVKKMKSPLAKKQNYPSLNLYKKASPVENSLQLPLSPDTTFQTESVKNYLSPLPLSKELSPFPSPKSCGISPNTLNVGKDLSPAVYSPFSEKEELSLQEKLGKRPPDVPEKPRRINSIEPVRLSENSALNQPINAVNIIKAAKEAISAAKSKALSMSDSNKQTEEIDPVCNTEKQILKCQDILIITERDENSPAVTSNTRAASTDNNDKKKDPPPVPKRNFTKSDIHMSLDNSELDINGDVDTAKADVKSKDDKKEASRKQGKLKHIFSARQNNYIKNQRHARVDEDKEVESEESDRKVRESAESYEAETGKEIRDSENIISDLNALKELERARLAERIYDNAKTKYGVVDIVEQTKARNDLISRELRNIKKGMLSMRGNTNSKREVFAKKEKEQTQGNVYTKLDGNVIVNKALINDNYDRAKMALEEIISERERKKTFTEQEKSEQAVKEDFDKVQKPNLSGESEGKENGIRASELKERLGDLRDHNHMRHILSQTEPRLGETHRGGTRIALPGMDKMTEELNAIVKAKSEKIEKLISNYLSGDSKAQESDSGVAFEESNDNTDKRQDAPPVPPRSRKGSFRRDSFGQDTELNIKHAIGDLYKSPKDEIEEVGLTSKLEFPDFDSAKTVHSKSTSLSSDSFLATATKQLEKFFLSPEIPPAEIKKEVSPVNMERKPQPNGTGKVKRRAPLPPDHLSTSANKDANSSVLDRSEKALSSNEEPKVDTENLVESPMNVMSPLLLVNGVSVCQSPPDQASLSSKSSYFSAESTLLRNTETESNIYHSLENLFGEIEEMGGSSVNETRQNSDRTEYYSFSDHDTQNQIMSAPNKDPVVTSKENGDKSIKVSQVKEDETGSAASSNPVSPTFAIPALFKVKDNTFSQKPKKTTQPWSPRASLFALENVITDLKTELQESHEGLLGDATVLSQSETVHVLPSSPQLILPKSPPSEIFSLPQDCFLQVPEMDFRNSDVSPMSEGVDSAVSSAVETADEAGLSGGIECKVSKVPSERSASTCSGNDSQTGLPKPPTVLPKSEKAVLKAIKLTNRRIKKEEAQKSSHKSKHRSDRHRGEKSKSGERKHKEKTHSVGENVEEAEAQSQNPADKTEQTSRRQSLESSESSNLRAAGASERPGRSVDRQVREKPEHRHYSSDRVFSNVPVYKATLGDRTRADRPFQRSLSTDRYMESRAERRLSTDMSIHDRADPRSQRIEKSIMEELQQRGRQKEKPSKENPIRRSLSIDSQNVLPPPNLSRQSSLSSQFSRQSSMEHAVIAPSFPLTQRKLLQDPDSGHYFFVDMPVQVKTKTFYDPETGTYVQLPVQPPEGAMPQPSPMEVLSPPLMVYHSFVPVSLSPLAQAAPPQPQPVEHQDRGRRLSDGQAFLEPVFGPHEHMLGDFFGTEELDCAS